MYRCLKRRQIHKFSVCSLSKKSNRRKCVHIKENEIVLLQYFLKVTYFDEISSESISLHVLLWSVNIFCTFKNICESDCAKFFLCSLYYYSSSHINTSLKPFGWTQILKKLLYFSFNCNVDEWISSFNYYDLASSHF